MPSGHFGNEPPLLAYKVTELGTGRTINIPTLESLNLPTLEELIERSGGIEAFLREQSIAAQESRAAADATTAVRSQPSARETALTAPIKAVAIGDRVPVVFGRRLPGGTGGIMVQPKATEIEITNTATSLTVRYHCVLGDGLIGSVQVRDVRNGLSRQGSFSQNYNKRAGSWSSGNKTRADSSYTLPVLPQNCGIGGNYKGVSTIEFTNTYPIDSDAWKQSWNVFVRNGMQIDRGRLLDGVVGPSNNICDLLIWALTKSGQLKESQINMTEMVKTATFIDVNELYCDAEFFDVVNLADFLVSILPAFLLRETTIDGKFAVVPLLQTNPDGTIKTTPIIPDYVLTEQAIVPGTYSARPASFDARKPLQISALWRQQTSETEPAMDRDLQVGVSDDVLPVVEEFDLRAFATSESHAALAAGYRHAMRTLGGGTGSVSLAAGTQSGQMRQGQIAQVWLQLASEREPFGAISTLWWIDQISLAENGSETLQLIECPVDSLGRSLVALRTLEARALAPGVELPYPAIGAGDEPGRASDTTVPPDTTGGVPFSDGRGGGTNRFNRVDLQRPGPPAEPPGPPTDGGGGAGGGFRGNVIEAGGEPRKGDNRPGGNKVWTGPARPGKLGPIVTHAWPGECEFGLATVKTRIRGISFGAGGMSFGYADIQIDTVERVSYEMLPETGTYEGVIVPMYEVRYSGGTPYSETVLWIGDSTETPFDERGRFRIEELSWRCRQRDGTSGPLRNASDPPL